MSVLVADLKVFSAIQRKINLFQYNKQVDINYCHALNFTEEESKNFVYYILELNELSYIKRYREENEPELKYALTFDYDKTISTLQLLKYLQCIEYNIEIETIKKGYHGNEDNKILPELMKAYNSLQSGISELQYRIIVETTNYNELNYSNV